MACGNMFQEDPIKTIIVLIEINVIYNKNINNKNSSFMNQNYLHVTNVSSLGNILAYLKKIKNPDDIIVFFDWDDTLVNPDHDNIIEPEITKKLFDYMKDRQIFYAIITGRFHDTVCDDNKRNIFNMQYNIINTMYPSLNKLGIDTTSFKTDHLKQYPDKIYDEYGKCVGVLYMGIFFSGTKGAAIKNWLRQVEIKKKEIIFIDDYDPYLYEVTTSLPDVTAFRRLVNYIPKT